MQIGQILIGARQTYGSKPVALDEYKVVRLGRKYIYVSPVGYNREIKVDPDKMLEVVDVGSKIHFYPSVAAYEDKAWCDKHGWKIAEKVKYSGPAILKQIAKLVDYQEKP